MANDPSTDDTRCPECDAVDPERAGFSTAPDWLCDQCGKTFCIAHAVSGLEHVCRPLAKQGGE